MADDIVAFLRARLDEDEQLARDACGHDPSGAWSPVETPAANHKVVDDLGYSVVEQYDVESDPWWTVPHIARHDPARVLRGVEAKRRIVDAYVIWLDVPKIDPYGRIQVSAAAQGARGALLGALSALASEWSDHPDYRQEWTP